MSEIDFVLSNFLCQNVKTKVRGRGGQTKSERPDFLCTYQPGGSGVIGVLDNLQNVVDFFCGFPYKLLLPSQLFTFHCYSKYFHLISLTNSKIKTHTFVTKNHTAKLISFKTNSLIRNILFYKTEAEILHYIQEASGTYA